MLLSATSLLNRRQRVALVLRVLGGEDQDEETYRLGLN